ncbi:DUF1854 domain-containing protein [Paenibacillus hemerocallicola]|jgi:hypothetical protein|uniref:DUF1854 domain-containing protein n=1 Tax=Paenibacillus hemerocallicola TaxID=1172614 RepID=A0A5C4T9D4_9BACL|nr:DUF1854 domain-containing protein [Paenibacillus hemerocallicola]TNJ65326.1 DUF1854 domain-containing protein [Paenibacillus hemerocallicola]
MTSTGAVTEAECVPDEKAKRELPDSERNGTRESDLAEAAKIRYVTERNATFRKTEGQMLAMTVDGTEHPAVYVHCSFPHTNKRIYLSIRTHDNKELGMIRSLDDFPKATADLIEEQVTIRYFAPEITKVVKIKEEFGYSYWETETTAGICRFTVRSGGGHVKLVTDSRLLISDVDGNRFVIPDLERLSEKEYRMVEMCM